jgi:site-specific recombinase XerD
MNPTACGQNFHRVAEALSMPDISVHTLRHSYAYWLLKSGASIRHIQLLLGHTSIATTQIYLNLFDPDTVGAAYQHPLAN